MNSARTGMRPISTAIACVLLAVLTPAQATTGLQALEDRVRQVERSAEARQAALAAGRREARFCDNCHGQNGVSVHPHIPNLAGQNPVYLAHQNEKFADGRRQDPFMTRLLKAIAAEDRFNLAIHYASLPPPPALPQDARLVAQGRAVYERSCQGCHGRQGHGSREIPRLAGQHPRYVTSALNHYRQEGGARRDPAMVSVAKGLRDADITAVAAFVANLN